MLFISPTCDFLEVCFLIGSADSHIISILISHVTFVYNDYNMCNVVYFITCSFEISCLLKSKHSESHSRHTIYFT